MTGDTQCTCPAQTPNAFAELCDLLSELTACARDKRFTQVERLCNRLDARVMQLKGADAAISVTEPQRQQLHRLYDGLVLMIRAEHADVGARLKQLRQVKRAVGAYGRKVKS
jgi:hypothetical protein